MSSGGEMFEDDEGDFFDEDEEPEVEANSKGNSLPSVNVQNGEWACIMCSLINPSLSQCCDACGTIRFDSETREEMKGVEFELLQTVDDEGAIEEDELDGESDNEKVNDGSDEEFTMHESQKDNDSEEWGEEEEAEFSPDNIKRELAMGADISDSDRGGKGGEKSGETSEQKRKVKHSKKKRKREPKSRNSPKINTSEEWEERRKREFAKNVDAHPNTYYHRFNVPGDSRAIGSWTEEETNMLIQRLKEVGPWVGWGIISSVIPRRHGMQCLARYKRLIIEGIIHDNCYSTESTSTKLLPKIENKGHAKFAITLEKENPKWILKTEMDKIRKDSTLHKWCIKCLNENDIQIDKCKKCQNEFFPGLKRIDVYEPYYLRQSLMNNSSGKRSSRKKRKRESHSNNDQQDGWITLNLKRKKGKKNAKEESSEREPRNIPENASEKNNEKELEGKPENESKTRSEEEGEKEIENELETCNENDGGALAKETQGELKPDTQMSNEIVIVGEI